MSSPYSLCCIGRNLMNNAITVIKTRPLLPSSLSLHHGSSSFPSSLLVSSIPRPRSLIRQCDPISSLSLLAFPRNSPHLQWSPRSHSPSIIATPRNKFPIQSPLYATRRMNSLLPRVNAEAPMMMKRSLHISCSTMIHEAQHFRTEETMNIDGPVSSSSVSSSSSSSRSPLNDDPITSNMTAGDHLPNDLPINGPPCGATPPTSDHIGPGDFVSGPPPLRDSPHRSGAGPKGSQQEPTTADPTIDIRSVNKWGVSSIHRLSNDHQTNVLPLNDMPTRQFASDGPVTQSQTADPRVGHTFVVAIDGSDESHWAWETASGLVRNERDNLIMLTVPVPVSPYSLHGALDDGIGSNYHRELVRKDGEHWQAVRAQYEKLTRERGITKFTYKLLPPSNVPGDDLLTYSEHVGANYIVVGHRGMSAVKRLMLGSVAYFMLQYAKCNVILAKRQSHQQPTSPNPTPKQDEVKQRRFIIE